MFQITEIKRHQNGREHVGSWHMYDNPMEPHLCVHLSLMTEYTHVYPKE